MLLNIRHVSQPAGIFKALIMMQVHSCYALKFTAGSGTLSGHFDIITHLHVVSLNCAVRPNDVTKTLGMASINQ